MRHHFSCFPLCVALACFGSCPPQGPAKGSHETVQSTRVWKTKPRLNLLAKKKKQRKISRQFCLATILCSPLFGCLDAHCCLRRREGQATGSTRAHAPVFCAELEGSINRAILHDKCPGDSNIIWCGHQNCMMSCP